MPVVRNSNKISQSEMERNRNKENSIPKQKSVAGEVDDDSVSNSVSGGENSVHRKGAWNEQEDAQLREIMSTRAVNRNWGEVASLISGRSAKQCRERWCYNLDPSITKSEWREEEDKLLIDYQKEFGNKWAFIAGVLPGRTENAVKTRFKSIQRALKREWKAEEDQILLKSHAEIGSKWEDIAKNLPNRTKNAVRTRYRELSNSLKTQSNSSVIPKPKSPTTVKLEDSAPSSDTQTHILSSHSDKTKKTSTRQKKSKNHKRIIPAATMSRAIQKQDEDAVGNILLQLGKQLYSKNNKRKSPMITKEPFNELMNATNVIKKQKHNDGTVTPAPSLSPTRRNILSMSPSTSSISLPKHDKAFASPMHLPNALSVAKLHSQSLQQLQNGTNKKELNGHSKNEMDASIALAYVLSSMP